MLMLDAQRVARRRRPGPFAPARTGTPMTTPPSREVLDALEGADGALISLGAAVLQHQGMTFAEEAMVELAMERDRIRQEWRAREAAGVIAFPMAGREARC